MNKIEIINMVKEFNLKEYRVDFKNIVKEATRLLDIENNLSMSLTICLSDYIHKLNKEYRSIDRETDVLSFALEDGNDEDEILEMIDYTGIREIGDIIINLDRVKSQAKEYGHSERREICFLFTHGVLHLLGYDHMEENEEKEMFELQETILKNLNINR